MNGVELMGCLMTCEQAKSRIPLELQASLPLVGRKGRQTAECWYYRLVCDADGVKVYSPERYVLWNIRTYDILTIKKLQPILLGDGRDILTKEHRRKEDDYLNSITDTDLPGENTEEYVKRWIDAAPLAMQTWLKEKIKEEESL